MTIQSPAIRIAGLGAADAAELRRMLGSDETLGDVRLEEERIANRRLGEPATFILIGMLTATTIRIIGAFLMKPRRRTRITYTLERIDPDGTHRVETMNLDQRSSDAPDSTVVEGLAKLTGWPADEVKKAIAPESSESEE